MGGRLDFTAPFVANGESALQHAASAPPHWRALLNSTPSDRSGLVPKRPRRRRNTRKLTTAGAALSGAVIFAALTQWGSEARQVRPFIDQADRLAELAGLGVERVFLNGHRMTADRDIFDALDLTASRSLLRFDGIAARGRIEQLPWIKSAAITRIFPDSISVEVIERKPFAVWHQSGRDLLIDVTGRVLGAAPPSTRAELPRVSGDGAATEAAALMALISSYPDVGSRLEEAVRVGARRWTLRLKGGPVIELPAGHEAEALGVLLSNPELHLLNGERYAAVDLRPRDRIIVQPRQVEEKKTASGHNAQPSG